VYLVKINQSINQSVKLLKNSRLTLEPYYSERRRQNCDRKCRSRNITAVIKTQNVVNMTLGCCLNAVASHTVAHIDELKILFLSIQSCLHFFIVDLQ